MRQITKPRETTENRKRPMGITDIGAISHRLKKKPVKTSFVNKIYSRFCGVLFCLFVCFCFIQHYNLVL